MYIVNIPDDCERILNGCPECLEPTKLMFDMLETHEIGINVDLYSGRGFTILYRVGHIILRHPCGMSAQVENHGQTTEVTGLTCNH
jgi:hypothetical protein